MTEPCRLYLITPPAIADIPAFAARLDEALSAGGVAAVQLRLKNCADDDVVAAGKALLPVCRAHDAVLIVNDRADLAQKSGADGVHLGQADGSIAEARALLGPDAVIGATCHDSRDVAIDASEAGADYVAFGAFFPTATKDAKTRAAPDILESWSFATTVPCVAIGGITPENCAPLVLAGADFLAVSSAVWDHPQGAAAAVRAFNAAIASAGGG
jgi:thiamine-phosphate pyrophosphorylase